MGRLTFIAVTIVLAVLYLGPQFVATRYPIQNKWNSPIPSSYIPPSETTITLLVGGLVVLFIGIILVQLFDRGGWLLAVLVAVIAIVYFSAGVDQNLASWPRW